jgi:molybdate transport system substrate-binding protein
MEIFMPRRTVLICLLSLGAVLSAATARAEDALVAVAANYAGAVEAVAAEFTRETGHTLQITTGATGKLYAQIAEGAPFDVMLSADAKTPARIEAEGLGVPGSRFTYAIGKLSLWSPDAGRIDADPKATLLAPETLFIAIANPDLAPYGVAAREAMQAMGVWDDVQPKIVMGQNIGQTFSMVDTGAAQVGFVATSALEGPGAAPRGSRHDIPQAIFTPIAQDAVLLNPGKDNPAARAFMDFLKGDAAKALAASFGYGTD